MAGKVERIGVVGASSLAGKELAEELSESRLADAEIVLLDDDDAAGQVAAAGDEASFIQRLEESSLDGLDYVFFTGDAETTRRTWKTARRSGAAIVDVTYALEREPGVLVRAPWVDAALPATSPQGNEPDLTTAAVTAAHPAAVMLALVAARLSSRLEVSQIAATLMEPASEHGRAAMDELHQQTVGLLSFQDLPREQYDAQVAFNLVPTLGEEARVDLPGVETRVRAQYASLGRGALPELAFALMHAPVFHGYLASMLVDLRGPATAMEVEAALAGDHVLLAAERSEAPNNLQVAGQSEITVRVSATGSGERSTRFWIWAAVDNLRLTAANAIACALELRRLRPQGKVQ